MAQSPYLEYIPWISYPVPRSHHTIPLEPTTTPSPPGDTLQGRQGTIVASRDIVQSQVHYYQIPTTTPTYYTTRTLLTLLPPGPLVCTSSSQGSSTSIGRVVYRGIAGIGTSRFQGILRMYSLYTAIPTGSTPWLPWVVYSR